MMIEKLKVSVGEQRKRKKENTGLHEIQVGENLDRFLACTEGLSVEHYSFT